MNDIESHPQRHPSLAYEHFDGEMVVVKADEAMLRTLNPVGSFVFERLDGQTSREQLILALTEHFAVSPENAAADLDRFLADLGRRGLLAPGSS